MTLTAVISSVVMVDRLRLYPSHELAGSSRLRFDILFGLKVSQPVR